MKPLAECSNSAGHIFGLVVSPARGSAALFKTDLSGSPLVDLDPQPGFGFIGLGQLPTRIVVTEDSCQAVSVNSGSCDLSRVDLSAVMISACEGIQTTTFGSTSLNAVCPKEVPSSDRDVVSRLEIKTKSGRSMRARPQDIVFATSSRRPVPSTEEGATVGCRADVERTAYISFPGCDYVAEIDLRTGVILQGVKVGSGDFELSDEPECPIECGPREVGDSGTRDSEPVDSGSERQDISIDDARRDTFPSDARDAGMSDAGESLDGTATAAISPVGVRPHSLALSRDGKKLFISSSGAPFISVVDIAEDGVFQNTPRKIVLDGDVSTAATTRIALSPLASDEQLGEFVYAIARDRSVRVVSVDLERECETQLDLARLPEKIPLDQARCFPVGDPGSFRRVGSERSGITFGVQIPQDITFITQPTLSATDALGTSEKLHGLFALISLSDGRIAVVDVEDRQQIGADKSIPVRRLPHRIRNGSSLGDDEAEGGGPVSVSGAGVGGVPVVITAIDQKDLATDGVTLRAIAQEQAGLSLIYEGQLLERVSGEISLRPDALLLRDPSVEFCEQGVLGRPGSAQNSPLDEGDIVAFVGCLDDNECSPGQVCRRSVARPNDRGLCVEMEDKDRPSADCSPWLRGEREFVIRKASAHELTLDILPQEPQRVVLQKQQPEKPCRKNSDCQERYACAVADREVPGEPTLSVRQGQCFRPGCDLENPQLNSCPGGQECIRPLDGSLPRCASVPPPIEPWPPNQAEQCDPNAAKDSCVKLGDEFRCVDFPGLSGRCMRVSRCFSQLQRYQVRAGHAFVVGDQPTFVVADPQSGECRKNQEMNPLLRSRIGIGTPTYPIIAGPVCDPDVPEEEQTLCWQRSELSYTGRIQSDGDPLVFGGPATAIRVSTVDASFSLGVSHLATPVVPESAGAETAEVPPLPKRELILTIPLNSGYSRFFISGSAQSFLLPTHMASGPDGFVYVVDQRDPQLVGGSRGFVTRLRISDLSIADGTDGAPSLFVVR